MRLADLDAHLLKITEPGRSWRTDATWAEAQGVIFLCPLCWTRNGGPIGTHSVICWFRNRGVTDTETPGPGRWDPAGTGLDDLSLVRLDGGPSSVLLTGGGCGWHGHVTGGSAVGGY